MSAPASTLQKSAPGHATAWSDVWLRQEGRWRIIRLGRSIYNSLFFKILKPHLHTHASLLELGCGTASLGMHLASHVHSYTGIDAAPEAIREAQMRATMSGKTNMRFVETDVFVIPEQTEYDIVWSQGLIEHFEDVTPIILKHLQCCKPGGTVVISVPSKRSYLDYWYRVTKLTGMRQFWPWTDQRFFAHADLHAAMAQLPNDAYRSHKVHTPLHGAGILTLTITR